MSPSESLWILLRGVLVGAANFVAVRGLTEYLSPATYGNFTLILNAAGLATQTMFLPMSSAANRYYHEMSNLGRGRELLATVLRYYSLISLFLATMLGVMYASSFIYEIQIAILALALGIIIIDAVVSLFSSLFNMSRQRAQFAAFSGIDAWLRPILAISFVAFWGDKIFAPLFGYFLAGAIVVSGLAFVFFRAEQFAWKDVKGSSPELMGELLRYAYPFLGLIVTGWFMSVSDRYLVKFMGSDFMAGQYIAGYQVGGALILPLSNFYSLLVQPVMFQKFETTNSLSDMGNYLGRMILVGLPLLGGIIYFRELIMSVLVGARYREAVIVVPWVAAGNLCLALGLIANNVFLLSKEVAALVKIAMVGAGVNVVLNLALIPAYGIYGAGVSTFFAYGLLLWLIIWQGMKIRPWPFPFGETGVGIVACLLAVLAASIYGLSYKPADLAGKFGEVFVYCLVSGAVLFMNRARFRMEKG